MKLISTLVSSRINLIHSAAPIECSEHSASARNRCFTHQSKGSTARCLRECCLERDRRNGKRNLYSRTPIARIANFIKLTRLQGESKVLLAAGTPLDGVPILFPNDIDVDWEEEIVYMSDALTKWSQSNNVFGIIETDSSGRYVSGVNGSS